MTKENLTKILEYFIAEENQYLYYESDMYPTWVNRHQLIDLIVNKILIESSIDKERLRKVFHDFFIFHNDANKNTVSIDEYFDEWYDTKGKNTIEFTSKKPIEPPKVKKKECCVSDDGYHHAEACSSDPLEGYCCKFCGTELS